MKAEKAIAVLVDLLRGKSPGRKRIVAAHAELTGTSSRWARRAYVPTTRQFQLMLEMRLQNGEQHPTLGELAEAMGVTAPTISEHLQALNAAGLVEAVVPGSAAPRNWRLSPDGEALLDRFAPPATQE